MDLSTRRPWRLGRRGEQLLDTVLASVLVLGSISMVATGTAWGTLLSVAETAPLFLRRRQPVLVFTLVAGASAVQALTYSYPLWGQVAFPVALYSVARFSRPPAPWVALGVSAVATVVASTVWVGQFNADVPEPYRTGLSLTSYVPYTLSIGAIVVAAWALGTQSRLRRAYEAALVERGERMAAEAEQRAHTAAVEERTRVAREMHDVVAHGITAMIVQADGARYAAQHDPDVAVRTLDTVASTGRDSLTEMRRLLGLLRGTTNPQLVPQPGLGDLSALLADDVASGRVDADLPEPLPEVGAGVALTTYRVVQESLTNLRKHAGPGARAHVRVSVDAGIVDVAVVDDGRGAASGHPSDQPHGGLGLLGMRERVEVHGGTLEAGPAPGVGWRVRARIPA